MYEICSGSVFPSQNVRVSFDFHLQLVDLVVVQRLLLIGGHGVLDGGVEVAVEQLVVVIAGVKTAALPLEAVVPGRLTILPLKAQLLQKSACSGSAVQCSTTIFFLTTAQILLLGFLQRRL